MVLIVILIAALFLSLLYIIASWKIYSKIGNGRGGWKCLIPIYNEYFLFKKTWRIIWWIFKILLYIAFAVLTAMYYDPDCSIVVPALGITLSLPFSLNAIIHPSIAMIIVCSLLTIISILQNWHLSKSFNHSVGYTIGLTLFDWLFTLILGFGSSRYIGNSTHLVVREGQKSF